MKTINIKHINTKEAHECNNKIKFSSSVHQNLKELDKIAQKTLTKRKKQAHNPLPTTHSHPTIMNDNDKTTDINVTAAELKALEEMLENTMVDGDKKEIEEQIKIAQVAHKHAIIADGAKNNQGGAGTQGGREQKSTGVITIDIEDDGDTKMTTEGAKRSTDIIPDSPGKKKRTEQTKDNTLNTGNLMEEEGTWEEVPPGGCNGEGGMKGRGRSNVDKSTAVSKKTDTSGKTRPAKETHTTAKDTANQKEQEGQLRQVSQEESVTKKTNKAKTYAKQLGNPYSTQTFASVVGNENEIGTEITTSNMIRIRFAFKGNQSDASVHGQADEIKRVLGELTKILKKVDSRGKILQWETTNTTEKGIAAKEIPLLSPMMGKKYLDIPAYIRDFGVGRMNHRIGLRVATDMKLREFLDTWNGLKPKSDPTWIAIQQSEMQKSSKFFAVGFLQGSSEKKDTTTINKTLSDELGVAAEVSWQYIKQDKITNELWDKANEQATKMVGKNSKQYNRVKFSWAPAALVVYVANKEDVKPAKRLLLQKYGKEVDEMWPQWCDGSRMKCVPLIQGKISNERAEEQIRVRMKWQVFSKANEITLELPLTDLHEPKEYLNNRSMEQVILGTMSDTNKTLSLFKHITHKYTRNPAETKYQVTVYKSMEQEAIARLEEMKTGMHDQFGNEVLAHFDARQSSLMEHQSRRREHQAEEFDKETEEWLVADLMTEKEGFLEPGFKEFIEFDPAAPTSDSTIHEDTTKASDESSESADSKASTINSGTSEVSAISWVSGLNTDRTSKEWRNSSRIQKKLDAINITSEALEKWKNDNHKSVQMLTVANSGNVYKTMSQIIKCIAEERKMIQEMEERQESNDDNHPTGVAEANQPGNQN